VYIALGNFLTSAAILGMDTCPLEGIVPKTYDESLGIARDVYATRVVAAAGYRATDDAYASLAKVRFAKVDVIHHVA
jgi:nitroreductase